MVQRNHFASCQSSGTRWFAFNLALAYWLSAAGVAAGQELYQQLTERGLKLPPATTVLVPAPALQPQQTPAERKAVLEKIAGKQGWEKFTRDSIYAPVTIDIKYILDAEGTRIGHNIHTAFVAYAPLATLRNEALMKEIFGSSVEEQRAEVVDTNAELEGALAAPAIADDVLQSLGITINHPDNEQYRTVELPFLNQVKVRGTVRIEKREGPNWVQVLWMVDPRFSESERYKATWTKMERTEVGEAVATEPRPYSGCGGYLAITELDPETQQLLIESRMILHEPVDWFAGSNFLRAKLPPALQENARSFRRRLQASD